MAVSKISTNAITNKNAVYSLDKVKWSEEEVKILHQGLKDYPPSKYKNVMRYINICNMLPKKSVRDVAYKIVSLKNSHESKGKTAMPIAKKQKVAKKSNPTSNVVPIENAFPELQVNKSLEENMLTLNKLRENLMGLKLEKNIQLMECFQANYVNILQLLSQMNPKLQLPKLPVEPDMSLVSKKRLREPEKDLRAII